MAGHLNTDIVKEGTAFNRPDAELLEAVGRREIGGFVAVEVEVIDSDVTEPVELRSDADPAGDDVVVIGENTEV
jgi:hypothetical protein